MGWWQGRGNNGALDPAAAAATAALTATAASAAAMKAYTCAAATMQAAAESTANAVMADDAADAAMAAFTDAAAAAARAQAAATKVVQAIADRAAALVAGPAAATALAAAADATAAADAAQAAAIAIDPRVIAKRKIAAANAAKIAAQMAQESAEFSDTCAREAGAVALDLVTHAATAARSAAYVAVFAAHDAVSCVRAAAIKVAAATPLRMPKRRGRRTRIAPEAVEGLPSPRARKLLWPKPFNDTFDGCTATQRDKVCTSPRTFPPMPLLPRDADEIEDFQQLYVVGNNVHGQLGIGRSVSNLHTHKRVRLRGLVREPQLSMNEAKEHDLAFTMSPRHTLAPAPQRIVEGHADCAASTAPGGDGRTRPSTVPHASTRDPRPRAMQPLPRRQQHVCVSFAAAGGCHSLVLTGEGDLLSFGLNHRGQLGLGHERCRRRRPITRGKHSSAAGHEGYICRGTAKTGSPARWLGARWPSAKGKRVGPERTHRAQDAAVVPALVRGVGRACGREVHSMACGFAFSVVLLADGTVLSFGSNSVGQLGLGHVKDVHTPTTVTISSSSKISAVFAGNEHACALEQGGILWTWGANKWGQLGHGNSLPCKLPRRVNAVSGVRQVALGKAHSVVLTEPMSRLLAFGCNSRGQLGLGNQLSQMTPVALPSSALTAVTGSVVQVVAGGDQTFALTTSDDVYGWGHLELNLTSDLSAGDGKASGSHSHNVLRPRLIDALTRQHVVNLSCGSRCVAAVTKGGGVIAGGNNASGQLGLGHLVNQDIPCHVPRLRWSDHEPVDIWDDGGGGEALVDNIVFGNDFALVWARRNGTKKCGRDQREQEEAIRMEVERQRQEKISAATTLQAGHRAQMARAEHRRRRVDYLRRVAAATVLQCSTRARTARIVTAELRSHAAATKLAAASRALADRKVVNAMKRKTAMGRFSAWTKSIAVVTAHLKGKRGGSRPGSAERQQRRSSLPALRIEPARMLQRVRRKQARARRRSDAIETQIRLERSREDIVSSGAQTSMVYRDQPITTAATHSSVSEMDRSFSSPLFQRSPQPQPANTVFDSAGHDFGSGSTWHSDCVIDRGSTEDEGQGAEINAEPEPKDVVDRGAI